MLSLFFSHYFGLFSGDIVNTENFQFLDSEPAGDRTSHREKVAYMWGKQSRLVRQWSK